MMPIDLTLPSPGPFRPGDAVRVAAEWSCPEPPDRIEVRLIWRTSGKGTTDVVIATADAKPAPPAAGRWETSLRIPFESPMSYDGKMLSVEWFAEANTGQKNDAAERTIVVSPTGRPIVPTVTPSSA